MERIAYIAACIISITASVFWITYVVQKRFADDEAQIANLSNAVMHLLHDTCGSK